MQKASTRNLRWRLDADFVGPDFRVIQFTPPGSECSIHFGKGVTTVAPGLAQGLYLVVKDIEAAQTDGNDRVAQMHCCDECRRTAISRSVMADFEHVGALFRKINVSRIFVLAIHASADDSVQHKNDRVEHVSTPCMQSLSSARHFSRAQIKHAPRAHP